jgi:glycosyltransferase involved in cell wall biosynthesis
MVDRRSEIRQDVRTELAITPEDLLVVTVANLRSEKGYDVLIDAAHLIAQRGLPIRFAAAGRGTLQEDLATKQRAIGLDERFRFLGHRDDAFRLLAAADVFVLASHQEGLPVALMEAMSVGAAIVATAVGGVPQVITDEVNGLIVPPGDPLALADAIERICSDAALRRRLGSQALVDSSRFDIARASGEIEEVYRRLVGPDR